MKRRRFNIGDLAFVDILGRRMLCLVIDVHEYSRKFKIDSSRGHKWFDDDDTRVHRYLLSFVGPVRAGR